jgi:hypothetical protein
LSLLRWLTIPKLDYRFKDLGGHSILPTPRPANASFPLGDLSSVAGKYYDPGYGEFELCLVSPNDSDPSAHCKGLAANISTVLPGTIPSGIPTFFAEWNSDFFTHLRFTHFDGSLFNISVFASYVSAFSNLPCLNYFLALLFAQPTSNASTPFWASDFGITDAFAVVDDQLSGMGFFGVWGAGNGVPGRQGSTIRERAEVWFDKSTS